MLHCWLLVNRCSRYTTTFHGTDVVFRDRPDHQTASDFTRYHGFGRNAKLDMVLEQKLKNRRADRH